MNNSYAVVIDDKVNPAYRRRFTANLITPNADDIVGEAVNQAVISPDLIQYARGYQLDFAVDGGGTIYTLTPLSDAANEWIKNHIPEDAQRLGNSIAVEHRYIADIVQGAQDDGLAVI